MIEAGFIREVEYPNWLANVMIVPKKTGNGEYVWTTQTRITSYYYK